MKNCSFIDENLLKCLTSVELCFGQQRTKLPRRRDAGAGWRTNILTSKTNVLGGTKTTCLYCCTIS